MLLRADFSRLFSQNLPFFRIRNCLIFVSDSLLLEEKPVGAITSKDEDSIKWLKDEKDPRLRNLQSSEFGSQLHKAMFGDAKSKNFTCACPYDKMNK